MPESSFFQQVYEIVKNIPPGFVMSYGQIALLLGHPRGSRLVGWAMHTCPAPLPWHRVIKKSGEVPLSNPFHPESAQRNLLQKEGISFLASGRVDMKKHQYQGWKE
jgi:methylated-DNA-protein-cysteine methyltransferase-like protein